MSRYFHWGSIYFRNVIFDEEVFPFASLHENAGARLRHEISLLHEHLLSSHSAGVDGIDQYFANANPDHPTSDVNNLQKVKGDDCEIVEENLVQNQLPGAVHGGVVGGEEANRFDTESEVDLPAIGAAVGVDPISLGSRADPPAPSVGAAYDTSSQARGGTGQAAASSMAHRTTRGSAGQAASSFHAPASADGRSSAALGSSATEPKHSASKPGHKVEFLNTKFILMALFAMQTLAPQVNQQI
jgi:hypothetical protein